MKKVKRIVTLALASLMSIALFAGCSADKKESLKTEEADFVVVGGGAAGLMSALELGGNGKVVLLEKMPALGGTTIRSKGYLWSVDSKINKEANVGLSGEELTKFYKDMAGEENFNDELFKKMVEVSGSTVDELVELGIPFSKTNFAGGTPNYPELQTLTVEGEGPALISAFNKLLKERNVEIRMESSAEELIIENGEVKGVVVKKGDEKYNLKSQKVILSTGGFTRNEDMMDQYNNEFINNIPFSGVGSTGDGILMAEKAGAQLIGDGVLGIWGMNEKYGYVGDIGSLVRQTAFYINKDGNRFVNEKRYYAEVHNELNKLEDKHAYGLLDSRDEKLVENLEKGVSEGLVVKANTIEELADLLKVNKDNLVGTVNKYNEAFNSGNDAEFGLKNKQMTPMLKAPFYAYDVKPTIIGTIKGVKVNDNAQVLDKDNNPIKNLYATGEMIIGNFINKAYPATGTVVATGIYSGKIAATHAKEGVTPKFESEVSNESSNNESEKVEADKTVYKYGIYEGQAKGMNDAVKVSVEVKEGKISKVEILDSKDTAGISDAAIEKLPEMIVSKNSPEVDSISGATSTSDAIKEAVTEALKQAK